MLRALCGRYRWHLCTDFFHAASIQTDNFFYLARKNMSQLKLSHNSSIIKPDTSFLYSPLPPLPHPHLPSFCFHIPKYQAAEQQTPPVSPRPISVGLQHCYLPVMVGFSCLLCLWQHKLLLWLLLLLLLPGHRQLENWRQGWVRKRGGKEICSI